MIIFGVDMASGPDTTAIWIYETTDNGVMLRPILSGDVAQMVEDIDRVELTKRTEEEILQDAVARMEEEFERHWQWLLGLVLIY